MAATRVTECLVSWDRGPGFSQHQQLIHQHWQARSPHSGGLRDRTAHYSKMKVQEGGAGSRLVSGLTYPTPGPVKERLPHAISQTVPLI